MTAADLEIEHRGAVMWIRFNRPQRLNAITPNMRRELLTAFQDLASDTTVRVVILRGNGRGFCAGLDIVEFQGQPQDSGEIVHLPDVIKAMRACPQPIISAVHGPVCGGGFAFALASDVRIAGESTRMNDAFVRLGVSGAEMGVSYFLPRIVGLTIASELMLTGRFIDAARALKVGLVSEVVPDDGLDTAAGALAEEMLAVAPLALRKTKEVLNTSPALTELGEALAIEDQAQLECIQGPDFEEGLRAFLEKRQPSFGSFVPSPPHHDAR